MSYRSSTVDAIDLFCGFGGSSQGIVAAGAEVKIAANHNPHAIEVHSANHPEVEHVRADISDPDAADYQDPALLPPARYLWASPSCRYHSPANAKKVYRSGPQRSLFEVDDFDHELYAKSERSRVTMMCPLRYAAHQSPELVVVENVVEAAKWGPNRDGSTFEWWLREWDKLGYESECVFLNSMFFGVPQSRDRMYVVFWKKGNRRPDLDYRPQAECSEHGMVEAVQSWKKPTKAWPLLRWGKYDRQYVYRCGRSDCGSVVVPHRSPAFEAIDWSDLGTRLADRAKPLAAKTMERIRRGLERFADWPAVVIPAAGNTFERPGQLRARHPGQPLFTQTGTAQHGVAIRPFMINMRGGGSKEYAAGIDAPIQTVTGGGLHHALISAAHTKFNGGPGDTAWHPVSSTLGTTTARDTTGLLTGSRGGEGSHPGRTLDLDDVRFRMLKPDPELRRAMGFSDDFILLGTKTQMTAGLGNAVTPPVADWLTARVLETLDA